MHNIKLIALDLDGTLLGSDKQLSAENAAALERAAESGIEIVPATGRFYRGMPESIRELPFIHYAITVNGAQVYDIEKQKTVCASEIPWQRAVSVLKRLDEFPLIYDCYQDGWGFMTQAFYDKADKFAATVHNLEMMRKLRTPVPELKEYLKEKGRGVQKIQVFFNDKELRARLLGELPDELCDLVVTTSIVNNIEINSREATKGNALKSLAGYLNIPTKQTMAFGDDLNDITMLEEAGIGVAMGNASKEVKEAADFVTADCNESGVAKAIEHIIFGEKQ